MADCRKTHDLVKRAYGEVARKQASCCDSKALRSCCSGGEAPKVPEADLGLSCGNPVAFSEIKPGDVVVDLGSGAGRDVFLAAEKVGPAGRAIGVDMTPEMLCLARENADRFEMRTGLANVEFRQGLIENLPIDDASADLVISNCVINLSPDKARVFREIHRVLKPGGRMVVSDIVLNRPLPEAAKNNTDLYTACIAGALLREDYLKAIRDAGFTAVKVLKDVTYDPSGAGGDPVTSGVAAALVGVAASVTIMAVR